MSSCRSGTPAIWTTCRRMSARPCGSIPYRRSTRCWRSPSSHGTARWPRRIDSPPRGPSRIADSHRAAHLRDVAPSNRRHRAAFFLLHSATMAAGGSWKGLVLVLLLTGVSRTHAAPGDVVWSDSRLPGRATAGALARQGLVVVSSADPSAPGLVIRIYDPADGTLRR